MKLMESAMYPSSEAGHAAGPVTTELIYPHDVLLHEMQHRVANSLQIIASILMLKAQTVPSEEARSHLQDAYHRILSVATVQRHLEAVGPGEPIELGPHLTRLCATLSASMIGDTSSTSLQVQADAGTALPDVVMNIGLIITEVVINALKYAFPNGEGGKILVRYEADGAGWRLSVSDNGVGIKKNGNAHTGLGTGIVEALAKQIDARVDIGSGPHGTMVSITHGKSAPGWSSLNGGSAPPKSNGGSVG
jgi:two-component sensor histidine kinase